MQVYNIYVNGQLDRSWLPLLDGFTLLPQPDGTTLLSGPVPDQAALFGVLARLRDMGLAIERVEHVNDQQS